MGNTLLLGEVNGAFRPAERRLPIAGQDGDRRTHRRVGNGVGVAGIDGNDLMHGVSCLVGKSQNEIGEAPPHIARRDSDLLIETARRVEQIAGKRPKCPLRVFEVGPCPVVFAEMHVNHAHARDGAGRLDFVVPRAREFVEAVKMFQ